MKNITIVLLSIFLVASVITGIIATDDAYEKGVEVGKRNPVNVVQITGLDITMIDGRYHFTVTTDNSTFTVVEINK